MESENRDNCISLLEAKRHFFDENTINPSSGNININNCIDSLTETIHVVPFQCFGQTFTSTSCNRNHKVPWIDEKKQKNKREKLKYKSDLKNYNVSLDAGQR